MSDQEWQDLVKRIEHERDPIKVAELAKKLNHAAGVNGSLQRGFYTSVT